MLIILSATDDRAEWDGFFDRLPTELQDVHFTSAYARIHESRWPGHAILVVFTRGSDFVMQPMFMMPVGADHFELTSLYGYGGPIGASPELAAPFQDNLWAWARREYIVSEFCCMHPLFDDLQGKLLNHAVNTYLEAKEVVVVDLTNFDIEHLRRRVRRGIKAAKEARATLHAGTPKSLEVLYDKAMERLEASAYWKHSLEYWDAYQKEGVGARFWEVWTDGGWHRALLTIGLGETAYAHFLGSDDESRGDGLDDFMYFKVACELRDMGFKRFHLGGDGPHVEGAQTNSLLFFKSGFSDVLLVARRYGRIFDATAYESLCNRKAMEEQEQHGRESTAEFFPAYRRPFV